MKIFFGTVDASGLIGGGGGCFLDLGGVFLNRGVLEGSSRSGEICPRGGFLVPSVGGLFWGFLGGLFFLFWGERSDVFLVWGHVSRVERFFSVRFEGFAV